MRILMLAQSFAPIVGGEERVVEDLSRSLVERGHDVSIATLSQPGSEPPSELDGIRIHTLPSTSHRVPGASGDGERHHAPPFPDPETVLGLKRVAERENPDLVHAHDWIVHSYLPLNRRSDAALVYTNHDYGLVCATKRLLYRGTACDGPGPIKCVRCATNHYGVAKGLVATAATHPRKPAVVRGVDLFLPISSTVRDLCRLPQERSWVINNFIAEFPPAPTDADELLSRLPDEPYVLYFGDVTEDKGAWNLVSVYRALEDPPPLVMIGRNYLPELAGIPGIHFLDAWPHDAAIEALRRSMFTVVPSIWPEPFGLVALEAAAAGKAVIASRTGGLTDVVVDGETGILVTPLDRPDLRSALRTLIGDAGLRERMGAAAKERAKSFGPDTILPQFEAAYERAASHRRGRTSRTTSER